MNESVYDIPVITIDGTESTLAQYRGYPLLIVNTASRCGFTKQYAGLQALYERFSDDGLRVLAFPSNDFLGQEPGTEEEIKEFCTLNYHVTFDLFSKIAVKGRAQHPLFAWLTTRPGSEGKVSWNFNKFLIDRDGALVARWGSRTDPESDVVIQTITELLKSANE